jgi:hypothetical protein
MSNIAEIRLGLGKSDAGEEPASLDRRQFCAALPLLGATIAIGCGGSSGSPTAPTPSTPPTGNKAGVVSTNHDIPHVAVITAAQLSAGGALILDIGNGLHSHMLNLTSTQVTQIAGGARVSQQSSRDTHSDGSDPHSHTVTFN